MLPDLPSTFAATRESLRTLACYAISPARKARTGRIGLRPYDGGIATPPFDDGTRISVRGDELRTPAGDAVPVTTVAAAAAALGCELSSDPGVGHDLPPFDPESHLAIDAAASLALGAWYAFGQRVLDGLPGASEAQIWPEHFDLAVTVSNVNVGFSPGDTFHGDPYLYVGPHDLAALDRDDPYWNAPFGAVLPYAALADEATAAAFIDEGLRRLLHE